jgi:hypothetical protein
MITVLVEIDRASAILNGIAAQGRHVVAIPSEALQRFSPEERKQLLTFSPENVPGATPLCGVVAPTPAAVQERLRELAEKKAEEERARLERERVRQEAAEKEAAERLAKAKAHVASGGELVKFAYGQWCVHPALHNVDGFYFESVYWCDANKKDPWVIETLAKVEEAIAAAKAKDAAELKAKREAEALEDAAQLAAWEDYRARFIQESGGEDLIEREAAGVLPRDELRDRIRDALLEPLNDFAPFTRLRKGDINHDRYGCCEPRLTHEAEELTEMDTQTYADFKRFTEASKKIRPVVQDNRYSVHVEATRHTAECTCGGKAKRNSMHVEVMIGNEAFSRWYAL